jgi:hypothetical protein
MADDSDLSPQEIIAKAFNYHDPVRDQADAAREAADSIERFLQTLEPTIANAHARTRQTEEYGRLSPVNVVDGNGQLTEEQFQAMMADVPVMFTDGRVLPPIKKEPGVVIKQEPMD